MTAFIGLPPLPVEAYQKARAAKERKVSRRRK